MNKNDIEAIYPLSPMQQGMLFHTLYAPGSEMYFERTQYVFHGDLNVSALQQAWQQVVEWHPIFRTLLVWKDVDKPLQVVRRQVPLPWLELDWRELPEAQQQEHLNDLLHADRAQGFELSRAPLMRLTLMRLAQQHYHLIWSHHHLLLDGWSLPLVLHDVQSSYLAACRGELCPQPARRPYRDYIAWLQQQDLAQAEIFWRTTLRGFREPTPLAVERPAHAAAAPADDYAEQEIRLPARTTAALQVLARQQQLTLNTLVQGAWALLLARYSGRQEVLFGATVSGRPAGLPGVEQMIGLFINTLPVRVQADGGAPLVSWLQHLQERQLARSEHEHTPLPDIQRWSEVPAGSPLFETLYVFENYPAHGPRSGEPGGPGSLRAGDLRSFEPTN